MSDQKTPQIVYLDGLKSLMADYDAFVFDQWGVLHDGTQAYPNAIELLTELKKQQKKLVVLSNSGKLAVSNSENLERLGFAPDLFHSVITSGELFAYVMEQDLYPFLKQPVFRISTFERPILLARLQLEMVEAVEQASWILLSSVSAEVPFEDYQKTLYPALHKGLPLICANPDEYAITQGNRLFFGPGTLARWYEESGAQVIYLGKPYKEIYQLCRTKLAGVPDERVICVGDSLDHDILGANRNGFKSVLIGQGILSKLFSNHPFPAHKAEELALNSKAYPDYYSYRL